VASNLGNLAATVSLNIDPFQQSARVLETQTRSINRALQASETAWKNNSKNINAQKTQYDLTGKAIQVHTAQLEKQRQKYNGLKAEIGDVNDATVQQKTDLLAAEAAINKTATELERLTGKYNELGKQIAINESNWTKSGKALEEFGEKTSKVGQGFNDFGTKWTLGVTAPIVAGVTAVTTAAISWESSFAGVLKTNDEVIDKNGNVVYSYKQLEDGLRNLTKELPSTHAEIAAVAEVAGQLGIKSQDVVSFTKTMIDLGESTNLSAEEAATSIAKIANITGMTSDEYERFGSSVVALGNNFGTTESQIVALSNRLAAAGTLAGLSETEILGLATAMSSVGIEAEAGKLFCPAA
jgi:phage-related tail protein